MNTESALESPDTGTLLGGERKVLELIATGAPLDAVLDALCRVIDEQSGLRSSIFLLDGTGEHLRFAAAPRMTEAWRKAVASLPVTMTACGAAVTRREQIICADVATDPLFAGFYDEMRAADIRAVWCTPFFSRHGRPLGTFGVYSDVPGGPSALNLALASRATHLATIAVERHVTEHGLRESEIRFSKAFYANPASMTIASYPEGRFAYVNDAFVRVFGYSRAEAIGQTALDLGLYVNSAQRQAIMKLLADGTVHDVETQCRTRSGQVLDTIFSLELIEVLGQQHLLGIGIDITDRNRAQEELVRSEQVLRSVLDALPVGVVVMDPDGNIILSNPASQRIWGGLKRAGLDRYPASKGWWHDTGKRLEPDEWASKRALTAGETSVNQVIDIETYDGIRKIMQNSAVPIRDADGHITGAVVVNEDISARKRIEEQLKSSERLLSEAQRVAHLGSWTWDVPNHTVTWSDELYRLFGVEPGDIDPISEAMDFIHPDDRQVISTAIQHTHDTREPYSFVYRIHRRDGQERILHSRGYFVTDDGSPGTIFGTTQDVTERQQAEKALQTLAARLMHAQDDERRRIAQLLHETTAQDLAGLKMLLARLNRTSDRLTDADRALLDESVQLADRSMTEVRTLAYLLHPPFLDETGLLSAVRWYAQGFADRSGIHVDLDLPEVVVRLPQVVETTLFRVVQEGLINIHRHADSPTACIHLHVDAGRLVLEIEDHGRGIPREFVARLLGGSGAIGVGLSGMRERLKQLGGALEIESSRARTIVRAIVPVPAAAS